ncbi:MAG TPA: TetR/AcrR family transcriptional regulator [Solirubrobacteraceae bacterium]|nr:TetR/AcrR family transcriptional regulator [Solirubrobacteraceae bacterium]
MTISARSRRAGSHRKGDRNEQAILQTAERLLESSPLADVTVQALARGSGISRSSFYFYFGSKEDVLLTLLDRMAGEIDAAIGMLDQTIAEDPVASITAAIESNVRVWREHGPVLHALIEAAGSHDAVREAWHATMRRFISAITATIRAERARGAAPDTGPSSEQLAGTLVWANERLFQVSSLREPSALTDDEIVPVLVEVWYRAIYARPTR